MSNNWSCINIWTGIVYLFNVFISQKDLDYSCEEKLFWFKLISINHVLYPLPFPPLKMKKKLNLLTHSAVPNILVPLFCFCLSLFLLFLFLFLLLLLLLHPSFILDASACFGLTFIATIAFWYFFYPHRLLIFDVSLDTSLSTLKLTLLLFHYF